MKSYQRGQRFSLYNFVYGDTKFIAEYDDCKNWKDTRRVKHPFRAKYDNNVDAKCVVFYLDPLVQRKIYDEKGAWEDRRGSQVLVDPSLARRAILTWTINYNLAAYRDFRIMERKFERTGQIPRPYRRNFPLSAFQHHWTHHDQRYVDHLLAARAKLKGKLAEAQIRAMMDIVPRAAAKWKDKGQRRMLETRRMHAEAVKLYNPLRKVVSPFAARQGRGFVYYWGGHRTRSAEQLAKYKAAIDYFAKYGLANGLPVGQDPFGPEGGSHRTSPVLSGGGGGGGQRVRLVVPSASSGSSSGSQGYPTYSQMEVVEPPENMEDMIMDVVPSRGVKRAGYNHRDLLDEIQRAELQKAWAANASAKFVPKVYARGHPIHHGQAKARQQTLTQLARNAANAKQTYADAVEVFSQNPVALGRRAVAGVGNKRRRTGETASDAIVFSPTPFSPVRAVVPALNQLGSPRDLSADYEDDDGRFKLLDDHAMDEENVAIGEFVNPRDAPLAREYDSELIAAGLRRFSHYGDLDAVMLTMDEFHPNIGVVVPVPRLTNTRRSHEEFLDAIEHNEAVYQRFVEHGEPPFKKTYAEEIKDIVKDALVLR